MNASNANSSVLVTCIAICDHCDDVSAVTCNASNVNVFESIHVDM
jgi:hypothetical protein